jgi:hypothetical protein
MNAKGKYTYIYLLTGSVFISISVFEILLVLGLLYTFFSLFKERKLSGVLSKPLILYSFTTVISTFLFNIQKFVKSVEEGIFQLIYFFPVKGTKETAHKIGKIFITAGILLVPIAAYRYYSEGKALLIWGSSFETAHFYAVFSLVSILLSVYYSKKNKNLSIIFMVLFVIFSFIVILTFRRTGFLEIFIGFFLILYLLKKNKLIGKKFLIALSVYMGFYTIFNYLFLSHYDYRFKEMNKLFKEKQANINVVSSSRYSILKDAVYIIKKDFQEKNILNILIGHGIRPGNYLPHIHDKKWKIDKRERYESFVLISEFIERGIIGVFAILWIMFSAFKRFFSIHLKKKEDLLVLILFIPLILHIIGTSFTFFWDALLPLYLLLFKMGEAYFEREKAV